MEMVRMLNRSIHHLGIHVATALLALFALVCVATGFAAATLAGGGIPGLAVAALVAVATFQTLRVPVGRASSWLLDR
jgi:hypothetical protein